MNKSRKELWHEQVELQHQMQGSGLNIVTCGNCGTVIIHKCDEREDIDCWGCGENMDKSDCPDYFY